MVQQHERMILSYQLPLEGTEWEPDVARLPCPSCAEPFATRHQLEMHRAHRHPGRQPFTCYSCGKVSQTWQKHLEHLKRHAPKEHKCHTCGKCFTFRSHLYIHLRAHRGEFKCNVCQKTFSGSVALKVHHMSHQFTLRHRCSLCGERFASQRFLEKHVQAFHNPLPCDICGKSFVNPQDLESHRKLHSLRTSALTKDAAPGATSSHSSDQLSCSSCSQTFPSLHWLEIHRVQEHLDAGPFACYSCKQVCLSREHLQDHLWSHGLKFHKCKICAKVFLRQHELDVHTMSHQGGLRCDICQKGFSSPKTLKEHRRRSHKYSLEPGRSIPANVESVYINKPHNCGTCGQGFVTVKELEDHQKQHPREASTTADCEIVFVGTSDPSGRLPCPFCTQTFPSLHWLETHKAAVHSHTGPFACYSCGNVCTGKKQLLEHLDAHRPTEFTCPTCGQGFPTAVAATEHAKAHTGNFQCHICHKVLSAKSSLRQHLNTHERSLPLKCLLCEKRFHSVEGAKKHMLSIHYDSNAHKCDACKTAFRSASRLKEHMKLHEDSAVAESADPVACPCCTQSFPSRCEMEMHKAKQHDTAPYTCYSCGKACQSIKQFLYHTRTHATLEYKCEGCRRRFLNQDSLRLHSRYHHGTKHECPECKDTFTLVADLCKHLEEHRVYECEACGKSFQTIESLKKHEVFHGDALPFEDSLRKTVQPRR